MNACPKKCGHRDPLQCAVPPYMLEKVAEHGKTAKARRTALDSLQVTSFFRSKRREIQRAFQAMGFASFAAGPGATVPSRFERRVYDAQNTQDLPGRLVRSEGGPKSADPAVNEVYDGAGHTDDLFRDEYGRNSIDDHGMPIVQTVHFDRQYQNAFWDGSQMIYGDGDGKLFGSFTSDLDIIAHELTHGVTQNEAALVYSFQSGALNESFSDVFGSLVKQRASNEDAGQANWLIGENVLIGKKYALRSMKAPGTAYVNHPVLGTDPQPASMAKYAELPAWEDQGGVHINSGIPNHAFYLAAIGIGGPAWKKAGLIWYRTLCDLLPADATFARCAQATIQAARNEFGSGSLEEKAVNRAWKTVGVL
ncbi:MAG: M4 family metallopeptidase [Verrucomicrobiota bacterium]